MEINKRKSRIPEHFSSSNEVDEFQCANSVEEIDFKIEKRRFPMHVNALDLSHRRDAGRSKNMAQGEDN